MRQNKRDDFDFNIKIHLFNFKNGVLNLKNKQFGEHKKEFFQTIQFNYDYDDKALFPSWLKFIADLQLEQSAIDRLQEWAGYCLFPVVKIQKCLFIKGEGANGKSVFLETLAAMLGNVSHLEISEMLEKHKVGELEGKLANICTDIETSKIINSRFKKIVSGETVTAEPKYIRPYEFHPFAKILFSANDYMPTKDRSHGFFRRFDIIEFSRTFTEKEQNPNLLKELEAELPGIFNWALAGLMRLERNGWELTFSQSFQNCHEELKQALNPVKQFIDEFTGKPDNLPGIETSIFREKYKTWCEINGYKPSNDANLGKEIKRLGYKKIRLTQKNGKRPHAYEGLFIKYDESHSWKF
jgi:putative DNA primase/helicase